MCNFFSNRRFPEQFPDGPKSGNWKVTQSLGFAARASQNEAPKRVVLIGRRPRDMLINVHIASLSTARLKVRGGKRQQRSLAVEGWVH